MYIYIGMYVYIYIYIYIERERESWNNFCETLAQGKPRKGLQASVRLRICTGQKSS